VERILHGRAVAEEKDSADRKRDIVSAIEQSGQFSETATVSNHPPPPTPHESSWTADDWAVAAISALIAIPLCEAGWHAVVNEPEHFARGLTAIGVGLPLGLAGFSFHRWKTKIPDGARNLIGSAALKWWPVAAFLAFAYFAGPEMYRRATAPVSPPSQVSPPAQVLCWDGPCAPTHKKPGPEYLKEIGLGSGPQGQPLMLQATPAATSERLRIFVDYSEYRSGWMPKRRAFIGEIKEPVKGKIERLQLITQATKENAGQNTLWWGDPFQNDPVTTPIYSSNIPAILVRARLAIIGAGGEQHHYFMLVRGAENVGTYVGILPEHDSGDWIESWERE
jgi:hypothetical protein